MSCYGANYNPNPTMLWTRKVTMPYLPPIVQKVRVLQYRNVRNSISKQQIYANIVHRTWTINKAYATQSVSYTNNNVNNYYSVDAQKIDSFGNNVPPDTPLSQCLPTSLPTIPTEPVLPPPPQQAQGTTQDTESPPADPTTPPPPPPTTPSSVPLSSTNYPAYQPVVTAQQVALESAILFVNAITNPCTQEVIKECKQELMQTYSLSSSGITCATSQTITAPRNS